MREAALISSTELETSVMQMWRESSPGELARERDASALAKSVCTARVRLSPPRDLVTATAAAAAAVQARDRSIRLN